MIFLKIFICIFLSLNIFAAENYIDSITLTKVKKLIEKEEEGILEYISNIKKSDNNATIYFVDYITKPKEIK